MVEISLVAVVVLALFSGCVVLGQNICPDVGDLYDGRDTCFKVVPTDVDWFNQQRSNESPFITANNFCQSMGKQLGIIRSRHQQNLVANYLKVNRLEKVAIGLRKQQTLWKWIGEDMFSPLSNQGCYKHVSQNAISLKRAKDRDECIGHCLTNPQNLFAAVVGSENHCLCSSTFFWESSSDQCSISCNGSLCGGVEAAYVVQLTLPRRSNESINYRRRAYDKWHPTEPSSTAGKCGLFSSNEGDNYWFAEDCETKLPYLCQFQNPNQPDLNAYARYQWLEDDVFVLMEMQPASFFEANFLCKKLGGKLATLNTPQKQISMEELFASRPFQQPGDYRFWIGLTSSDFSMEIFWPFSFFFTFIFIFILAWPDGSGYESFHRWKLEPLSTSEMDWQCAAMNQQYNFEWIPTNCQEMPTEISGFLCSGPSKTQLDNLQNGQSPFELTSSQVIGDYFYQNQVVGPLLKFVGNTMAPLTLPTTQRLPMRLQEMPQVARSQAVVNEYSEVPHDHNEDVPDWGIALLILVGLILIVLLVVFIFWLVKRQSNSQN